MEAKTHIKLGAGSFQPEFVLSFGSKKGFVDYFLPRMNMNHPDKRAYLGQVYEDAYLAINGVKYKKPALVVEQTENETQEPGVIAKPKRKSNKRSETQKE